MSTEEQQFPKNLDKQLWDAADRLRSAEIRKSLAGLGYGV
jgi:hypothetical protein